jgi:hypothetical protein
MLGYALSGPAEYLYRKLRGRRNAASGIAGSNSTGETGHRLA